VGRNRTLKNYDSFKNKSGQAWWYTSVIPTLRTLPQEDREIETSLDYIVNSRLAWVIQ
jgi:hypothetical protein